MTADAGRTFPRQRQSSPSNHHSSLSVCELQVRQIAIHNIVSFTAPNSEFFQVFVKNAKSLSKDLKALVKDDEVCSMERLSGFTQHLFFFCILHISPRTGRSPARKPRHKEKKREPNRITRAKHGTNFCSPFVLVTFSQVIAHDALRSLINLSGDEHICRELDDEDFLKHLVFSVIVSKKNILADLGCMLLSNMCKNESTLNKLISLQGKPVEGLTTATSSVAQLADIFLKGTDKEYNSQCNFDFLASVFAMVATV